MRHINSIATAVALVLLVGLLFAHCSQAYFFGLSNPFRLVYDRGVNIKNRILGHDHKNVGWQNTTQDRRIISGRGVPEQSFAEPKVVLSNGAPESSNDKYKARCFFWRKPNLKQNPKLFFFSNKNHSPDTRGCKVELEIPLDTKQNDSDVDPELGIDTKNVRAQLINSGLYNGEYPSFFLIHGFLSSWNGDNWMCKTKDLILDKSKANVFIVDWSGGAKPMLPIDYSAAVSNTKYVAQLVAEFINDHLLPSSGQSDASRFHLIGHSLGAHISGFIGYSVNKVGYITGLDPAGPCFTTDTQKEETKASNSGLLDHGKRRLSPESANFVVALHTDTALFGLNENCAHYDVYVNGGYKQPYCGSTSIASRFDDLLNLNFNDSFNPNIACAHSFAHNILDTFVNFVTPYERQGAMRTESGRSNGSLVTDEDPERKQRCYPMAYQCQNWAAFKSGECGFCLEDDTHCLYTGLSLVEHQPKKLADHSASTNQAPTPSQVSDDDKFNDEESDGNPPDQKPKNPGDDEFVPSEENSRGQHFIKSGSGQTSCLYHYQIIIASRRSAVAQVSGSQKYYYYLDIPLESSGQLKDSDGNRLHDRLVQVSHKVEQNSEAHNFLKSTYLHTMRSQNPTVKFESDDVEFYTALITFKQAPVDQCKEGDNDGATKSQKWQLCRPLDNIKAARLWSSSEMKLNAVEWVAMNYMSALHYEDRMSNSWVFDRDLSEGLKSRNELDESSRAQIGDLAPDRPKTTGNTIKKPVGCLLSFLDSSDSGTASRNFKCNRSANELKFAIKLNALKQKPL